MGTINPRMWPQFGNKTDSVNIILDLNSTNTEPDLVCVVCIHMCCRVVSLTLSLGHAVVTLSK